MVGKSCGSTVGFTFGSLCEILNCRPDLIVGPGGPRVLEVNFGPSNGSLALADAVQTHLADTDQGIELTRQGIALQPPESTKTLVQALRPLLRRCAPGSSRRHMLVAVATQEEAEGPKGHIVDFCNGLCDAGFHVSLAQLSEICTDDKKASLGGRRVDAVYCMGTIAEFQRMDATHSLLLDLIKLDRAADLRRCVLWVDETGNRTRHLCFGPSFVGGHHASTLLRAKSADGTVPIINAAQGAAVGPVLIRERGQTDGV